LVYSVGVARWNPLAAFLLFGGFLVIDLAFFGANLLKVEQGGWFPLAVALLICIMMTSWRRGRQAVMVARSRDALPLAAFIGRLGTSKIVRVPGTAVFMTGNVELVPGALLHNLKHNRVLHERVVIMTVRTEDIPRVPVDQRVELRHLGSDFHAVTIHYGFMDDPDIPAALAECGRHKLPFDLMETSFFVGREKIVGAGRPRLARFRNHLFIFMSDVMLDATEFFRIPANRVVELGGQVEI
jgi:KUP system potassium uptake protein